MEHSSFLGPQTKVRLQRTGLVYAALLVIGLALSQWATATGWQAFGLGLIMPGGGFLAYVTGLTAMAGLHLLLAVTAAGLFVAALVMWFAAGNALAPIAVWLGAAVAAGLMDHATASPSSLSYMVPPALAVGGFAAGLLWLPVYKHRALRTRQADSDYVAAQMSVAMPQSTPPGELSLADVQHLRFVYDRALQPLDQFDGFQWVDQFQTAAVRYQLNFAGYALAMAQYRLPAFAGYLHQAQVNLIDKQRDYRVWRYWQMENIWGNLRAGADPVQRDNIMYSGFVAAQVAYFQSVTGDMRFAEPGGFTLHKPSGECFEHQFGSLLKVLQCGWRSSPYCLMACEPNWVYPLCNGMGATAMIAADRQFNRSCWSSIEQRFQAGMESELMSPSGRLVQFRSSLTGIAPPAVGGALAEAFPSLFFNAVFPDEARRLWLLARRDMLKADGTLNIRRFWPVDTGDYRFTRATSYAGVAAAAAEMGDAEVVQMALAELQAECPAMFEGGVLHRERASVFSHCVELMARLGGAGQLADIVHNPRRRANRPVIDAMAYPDVLVAKADWDEDGLHCVLYPGGEPGRVCLPLSGFKPGSGFAHDGAASGRGTADDGGRASIEVMLDGRCELRVRY